MISRATKHFTKSTGTRGESTREVERRCTGAPPRERETRREREVNDELIESYGLMLMRLAVSMGLQRADAEDVAQDVLVKLLASGKAFADEEHRKAWLIRVGVNACKDVYRRRARRKDRLANDGERVPEPAVSEPGFEHVEIEQIIAALDADDRAFLYLSC